MELTKQQNELILEISKDFFRYTKNNLKIKDKDGAIIELKFNKAQLALVNRVLECLALGKPIRLIVLKARQMGLSTVIEAIIYWWTATHKNITAMIVGHEDSSSKNLYNMFKRYYEFCNPLFQPTRKYNTKNDLVFDVSDEIKERFRREGKESPGLGSIIKTSTAKNTAAGRSDTVQLLHGSEIGEWDNGEELVASLLQTVPLRPNTMIFLESTAKGRGNYFHKEWESAKKGESVFEPFFFPWWMHDEYEIPGEIEEYTEEELDIIQYMKDAQIPEEKVPLKINFRRAKEREFRSDPMKIYQEYPSTDWEAFLASGRARFDIKSLVNMERIAEKQPPVEQFTLKENEGRVVEVVPDKGAPLKIWDLPASNESYVIGADVAEGLNVSAENRHGDYSVADVIRTSDLKTVARWRGHIDPDLFGEVLDRLGRFYNNALIGVEVNNHGLTTIQRLRNLFYTNLYRRERGMDERFEESTSKLGWRTDVRTKPLMIDYLGEAIREGVIIDYDQVFISEAITYVIDDAGRTNADDGAYDDTVIAKAIALQMFEWSNNNKADLRVVKPKKMMSRKNQHKMIR
jgi:hypothetical protein